MIDINAVIHPTAVVYPNVEIEGGVTVGPYCVIGHPPEHREYYHGQEDKGVIIRAGARIFSHVTIDAGTVRATEIGERAAVFNHSHVAHDCLLGPGATVGGNVSLAGHTVLMEGANVSGKSCTSQFVTIGAFSFVGGFTFVTRNIPPGERWLGIPAKFQGHNDVGLGRKGITYAQCLEQYAAKYEELTGERIERRD